MQENPQPAERTGLIRVRYWFNRVIRGARGSGVEFHGLDDAPDSILLQLRATATDILVQREEARRLTAVLNET
jgi:hypothetical protein